MVIVEPGATAPLTIEVENTGTTDDQIEVGVEGIDGEWVAIPVPIVTLKPGEKQAVKVFFKPPRVSESTAGNFPFIAKVRSLTDGDSRTAQGVLTIKAVHSITVDVNPKKGVVSPTKRQNIFSVTLINMSNTEHLIQLMADDPEDSCTFEFDEEQVTLAPGQQKDVDFLVNPKKGSPFGSTRLVGFGVTGRSISVPSVVASSQGQLEIRPLLTPLTLGVFVVAAIMLLFFFITQPKRPSVVIEQVTKGKVFSGGVVTVHWHAENATSVKLTASGDLVKDNLPPDGQEDVPAPLVGTLKITATAYRENRVSEPAVVSVNVAPPIIYPDPEIVQFEPAKKLVNKGEKVTINYKFGPGVTKATLSPLDKDLNLNFSSLAVDPPNVGENTFEVAAYNAGGKVIKKSFTVTVQDPCLAKIVKFDADPMVVDPADGKIILSWQIATGARQELEYTGSKQKYNLEAVGSREITVIGDTEFKITAWDVNGKSITKTIVVKLKTNDGPGDGNAPPGSTTGVSQGTTTG